VILVDPRATFPACFKAEKVEPDQAEILRRFGLLKTVTPVAGRIRTVWNAGGGRFLYARAIEQYGIAYHDLVNAIRRHLPDAIDIRGARAEAVATGEDVQRVTLSTGEDVTGRLLVVASGTGGQLHSRLGLRRDVIRRQHSFAFGFDVEPCDGGAFPFDSVTYYPDGTATRVAFLTLFLVGRTMRANLFVFREANEDWVRRFLREPHDELHRVLPDLRRVVGPFRVSGRAEGARIDLYRVDGHRQPGVVVLGDAFQSVCPSTGTGVSRVLTDVDVLCSDCVPEWLATPGMAAHKIDRFYDHPRKVAMDAESLHAAEYTRRLALDPALRWRLHRWRLRAEMRVSGWRDYLKFTRKLTA
jgi:2-polyprenyl-6-methoxyphenol hydroxylase-like FAD-dependent oxidoreductase